MDLRAQSRSFLLSTGAALRPIASVVDKLLVGAGAGSLLCLPAAAQTSAPQSDEAAATQLEEVLVTGDLQRRYSVDDSALSKFTESLRDTPQSIAQLPGDLLEDRGLTSLNDALRTVPGITLGAGEFSWQGNSPSIRGFNARDDMYLDGLRDFGSYPRDPFNLESVDVLLGPSSILFGRGSTGGAINQVSKRPTTDSITDVDVNIGSDDTTRATLDLARPVRLLDGAAFRLNALAHRGEVADRDGARTERYGLAPSLAVDVGAAGSLTLGYFMQTSDDRPDYGLPWLDGVPAPVRRANFYGFDSDYMETDASIGTVEYRSGKAEGPRFEAILRRADYSRRSRITEPLLTPAPAAGTPLEDIDVFRYVFIGDSEEDMLSGQLNVTMRRDGQRVDHAIVTGLELSRESSEPVFAFGIGAASTDLLSPDPADPFLPTSTDPRVRADTRTETLGVYAIDTISFAESWDVILGVRWDRFEADYDAERFTGPATPFNPGNVAGREFIDQVDKVASYRAAFVYKASDSLNVYLAGSTSFNPSAQSLSFLTTGRGLGTGNEQLDPEENRSLELGVKADVKDGAVSVTGAVFEIVKTNARIPDPSNPGFNTLGGEQRMRGLSFQLSGMVTDRLYLSSGYAWLDGEVVRAAPGAAVGAPLANAPEHSASVWANYLVSAKLDLGFGLRYVAEQLAQNTGAGKSVPAYTLVDAMARYRFSDRLAIKVNVANVADELYFDQLHPWHVVPGAGTTATVALNMSY